MTLDDPEIAFQKWINKYSDYMRPEDGKMFVIRKPSDLNEVFEELDSLGV